jgi:hypothetical protein
MVCAAAAHADEWPALAVPPGARTESVASDLLLNGRRCKVIRFEVSSTEQGVLAFYRAQFGGRVVQNAAKNGSIIATRQGDYFHTVQLRVVEPNRIQATLISTLLSSSASSSAAAIDTERLMPVQTTVISTLQAVDAGTRSVMIIGVNKNSATVNRDHVVAALARQGFRIVRADAPDGVDSGSVSLQFASLDEEATVTIADEGSYRAVVIHRTRDPR